MTDKKDNNNTGNKLFSYIQQQFIDIAHMLRQNTGDILICHEYEGRNHYWHKMAECPGIPSIGTQTNMPADPVHHPSEISHRTLLPNEIVFEIDNDDYSFVRDNTRQLLAYMMTEKIPYYNVWSGNHSFHVHVLLDPTSVTVDKSMVDQMRELQVDFKKIIRKLIWSKILDGAGLNESDFDVQPINFTSDYKGHMIRMQGMKRPSGSYASVIDNIPDEKPFITIPQFLGTEPKLFGYARFKDDLLAAFEEALQQAKENDIKIPVEEAKGKSTPCQTAIMTKGAPAGKRHLAKVNLVLLDKKSGKVLKEAKDDVATMRALSSDQPEKHKAKDLQDTAQVYMSNMRFSCKSMWELFGKDDGNYCTFKGCYIHDDWLDQKGINPRVDYDNQNFCFKDGNVDRCLDRHEFYTLTYEVKTQTDDRGQQKVVISPTPKRERVCLMEGFKLERPYRFINTMHYRAMLKGQQLDLDSYPSFLKNIYQSLTSNKEKSGVRMFFEKWYFYTTRWADYEVKELPLNVVDDRLVINYDPELNTVENLQALNDLYGIVTNQSAFSIITCLSIMTPLSYYFRARGRVFPILMFDGVTQGGKSSMQELFAVKGLGIEDKRISIRRAASGKLRKSGDTEFAIRQAADKHLTIMMLEEMDQQWVDENTEFLKDIATSTGTVRKGQKDLTYYQMEFYPALYCNTNFVDSIPEEVRNRIIEVKFRDSHKKKQSTDWFKIDNKLQPGFLYDFFKKLTGIELDTLLKEQGAFAERKSMGKWYLDKGYEILKQVYAENNVELKIPAPVVIENWSEDYKDSFEGSALNAFEKLEAQPDFAQFQTLRGELGVSRFSNLEGRWLWITPSGFRSLIKIFNLPEYKTLMQVADRLYPSEWYSRRSVGGKRGQPVLLIPYERGAVQPETAQPTIEMPEPDEILLTQLQEKIIKFANMQKNEEGFMTFDVARFLGGSIDFDEMTDELEKLQRMGFLIPIKQDTFKVIHYNVKVFIDGRHENWAN